MHQETEEASRAIFARAKKLPAPELPFLDTRVLARYRELETERHLKSIRIWKTLSLLSSSLLVLAGFFWIHSQAPTNRAEVANSALTAMTDHPIIVRVELGDIRKSLPEVAHVQIDLPSGVRFYSPSHQELAHASSVTLALDSSAGARPYIPFAIQAESAGKKPVLVRFLDQNNKVVAERLLDIRFKKNRGQDQT